MVTLTRSGARKLTKFSRPKPVQTVLNPPRPVEAGAGLLLVDDDAAANDANGTPDAPSRRVDAAVQTLPLGPVRHGRGCVEPLAGFMPLAASATFPYLLHDPAGAGTTRQ